MCHISQISYIKRSIHISVDAEINMTQCRFLTPTEYANPCVSVATIKYAQIAVTLIHAKGLSIQKPSKLVSYIGRNSSEFSDSRRFSRKKRDWTRDLAFYSVTTSEIWNNLNLDLLKVLNLHNLKTLLFVLASNVSALY